MAYRRDSVFRTPLMHWEQLTLVSTDGVWNDGYRVDSPRLLLPVNAFFECRLDRANFVCDPSTALWLTPDETYAMRHRVLGQHSALLCLDGDFGPSRRAALPLDAHLHLGRWRRALADGATEPLALEEQIGALAGALLTPGEAARPHRAVERAREYIASAPGRSDTLGEIAAAAHCSPFHLARTFRARTGQSLHGFRTRLRMVQAIERLRDGETDLSALAADLGYTSHSHFTAVFRRSVGVAPARLRADLHKRTNPTASAART
jgi:AraC family transcriptional regulator